MPLIKVETRSSCPGSQKKPLKITVTSDNLKYRGKGICSSCGEETSLNLDGKVRVHKIEAAETLFYLQLDPMTYGQINAIADMDGIDAGEWARLVLAEGIIEFMSHLPTVTNPDMSEVIESEMPKSWLNGKGRW